MDKPIFDSKECNLLIEALDTWEKGDSSGLIMGSLLGAMVSGNDPVEKEKAKRKSEIQIRKFEEEIQMRKESSLRLKVKIMDMRDAHICNLTDINNEISKREPKKEN